MPMRRSEGCTGRSLRVISSMWTCRLPSEPLIATLVSSISTILKGADEAADGQAAISIFTVQVDEISMGN